jgi:hypothetical protein
MRGAFRIETRIKLCVVRIVVGESGSQVTCLLHIRKTGIEFRN